MRKEFICNAQYDGAPLNFAMRALNGFAVFLTTSCVANTTVADASLVGQLFSEVTHRGAALTDGEPALAAAVSWDTASGWFLGADGYRARRDTSSADLGASIAGHVGWFRELPRQRALELSVAHRAFPEADRWDYQELRADLHLSRDAAITLAWSPDYYGREAESWLLDGTWRLRFTDRAYASLRGGVGHLGGYVDSEYLWGEAGIGYAIGGFDLNLIATTLNDEIATVLQSSDSTVALRITYQFF